MAIGTVKWFNTTKGFGFIMPQDGGKDVFVHITAVQAAGMRGLNEGEKSQLRCRDGAGQGRRHQPQAGLIQTGAASSRIGTISTRQRLPRTSMPPGPSPFWA